MRPREDEASTTKAIDHPIAFAGVTRSGPRAPRSKERAELRAEAEDQAAASPTLSRSPVRKGTKPTRNAARVAAEQGELRDAADVDDDHAERAGRAAPGAADRRRRRRRRAPAHRDPRRDRKRQQIAAGGPSSVHQPRAATRRTPAGPAAPSARYSTSARAPAAAPSSPPTTSTASGWSVIGTGLNGTGTATCAASATTRAADSDRRCATRR